VAKEESTPLSERLGSVVTRAADETAVGWFSARLSALADGYDRNVFLAAYAGAGRRLRTFEAQPSSADIGHARKLGVYSLGDWSLDRFARCALIAAVLEAVPDAEHAEIVDEVYRTGDNAEREALLAGLALFPDPQRFLTTAIESCRVNVETVFAALACENAYPSLYFADANFNQMVMKAVFIGVSLTRVVGLEDRANAELSRMARHHASERTAAGRSVPADLDLISSTPDTTVEPA